MVKGHERVDDLQFKNLKIIQNPKGFCFGMDAVLLASFVTIRKGDRVVDFGTGTGILPLLLYGRYPDTTFSAFEIQKHMADMAERSVKLNGLEEYIKIYHEDIKNAPKVLSHLSREVVVCNPPYGKAGSTMVNRSSGVSIARHEQADLLAGIIRSAQLVLKGFGRLYMVFFSSWVLELCDEMRKEKIEPKSIRLVYPKQSKKPNIVLVEGIKGARPGLNVEKPLVVYDEEGGETAEIKEIYHKGP